MAYVFLKAFYVASGLMKAAQESLRLLKIGADQSLRV